MFNSAPCSLSNFFNLYFLFLCFFCFSKQVRWIRVLYSNFTAFTKDQEYLVSLHGHPSGKKFDYVEGFVIVDEGLINNWRSSFFSPRNPVKISTVGSDGGVLYCLEVTKNYFDYQIDTVDQVYRVGCKTVLHRKKKYLLFTIKMTSN